MNSYNAQLLITLEISLSKVRQDIKQNEKLFYFQESFPGNYEMGNPLNRWMNTGIIRTDEEAQKNNEEIENYIKISRIE